MIVIKNAVIFGDSIFKGVVFDGRYHLAKDKFKNDDIDINNYSKMGATIEDGIINIKKHIDMCDKNTIAVIGYGGNDCNYNWEEISKEPSEHHNCKVSPDQYRNDLTGAINLLKEKGCKVVVSTLYPLGKNKFMNFISQNLSYENILKWLGSKDVLYTWQQLYSDMAEMVGKANDCIIMPLREKFSTDKGEKDLCIDGIHPTEKRYAEIHRYVESFLATC